MHHRRSFIATSTLTSAALMNASWAASQGRKIRVAVMGLNRGLSIAADLAELPNVEVSHLCEVDQSRLSSAINQLELKTKQKATDVKDFRNILDDPSVDALVCAAPNHWHAPATIMACKAGKHVYVEKPCSHNPQEGEWMVEAANEFSRCVQMGSQRRSAPGTREAIKKLHEGVIGNVRVARCYYNNLRPPIGTGAEADPPPELDYELWQGPAPRKPYRDNYVHYNWHWFWHWGGGELANNGVHPLDLCRWALQADFPERVVSSGGRYWYDDDQETPDSQIASFEFPGKKQITWNALSCNKHRFDFFCGFYGDDGTLELDSNGRHRVYDRNDSLVEEAGESSGGQVEHLINFIDAIRADDASLLNQPIEQGHKSTLLCHLGNIAYRTGETVDCNPENGHILTRPEQQKLWRRDYDPAWEEQVSMPESPRDA